MKKRTTIEDIAKILGIHKSTVSRGINNPELVSKKTYDKIQKVCKKMNYIPNNFAKSLASTSSHSIAMLIPCFSNAVFLDAIAGVTDICNQYAYNLLLGDSSYTPLGEEEVIRKYLQQNVDGFILTETFHTQDTINLLNSSNIPTIEIMDVTDTPNFLANIGVNQYKATIAIVEYLLKKKNKHIALCSSWLDRRAMIRKQAWEECLTKNNLDITRYFNTKDKTSFASGAYSLVEILHKWPDTDAIFFINDDLAAGAIMECHRLGVKVGKDLDIVGFNDLDFADILYPSLTTLSTPRYQMGKLGAKTLIEYLNGSTIENPTIELDFQLKIRQSA